VTVLLRDVLNKSVDSRYSFSELNIGTPVCPAPRNMHAAFGYCTPFCFGLADGQTSGRARRSMRPTRRCIKSFEQLQLYHSAFLVLTPSLVYSHCIDRWKQDASWKMSGEVTRGDLSPDKSTKYSHLHCTQTTKNLAMRCVLRAHNAANLLRAYSARQTPS